MWHLDMDARIAGEGEDRFEEPGVADHGATAGSGPLRHQRKGETLGIVGKSGSGKSTLVKQILRFYNFDKNRIFINDIPYEDYDITSVRNIIYKNPIFIKIIKS